MFGSPRFVSVSGDHNFSVSDTAPCVDLDYLVGVINVHLFLFFIHEGNRRLDIHTASLQMMIYVLSPFRLY